MAGCPLPLSPSPLTGWIRDHSPPAPTNRPCVVRMHVLAETLTDIATATNTTVELDPPPLGPRPLPHQTAHRSPLTCRGAPPEPGCAPPRGRAGAGRPREPSRRPGPCRAGGRGRHRRRERRTSGSGRRSRSRPVPRGTRGHPAPADTAPDRRGEDDARRSRRRPRWPSGRCRAIGVARSRPPPDTRAGSPEHLRTSGGASAATPEHMHIAMCRYEKQPPCNMVGQVSQVARLNGPIY